MKSKIIYFVLYLVVIAELLVVIHERDLLIQQLKFEKLLDKYLNKLTIDIKSSADTYSTPTTGKVSTNSFTFFSPNLISDEEISSVQFFAELNPESAGLSGFIPRSLNTSNIDKTKKIYFEKVGSDALLTLNFGFNDLPGNIAASVATQRDVFIKYDVWCKTSRIIPGDYVALKTIEPLFNNILTDTSTAALISLRYGLKEKNEIENQAKRIVIRFMLGMNPKVLYELLDNFGEKYYFGIDKSKIESEMSKIGTEIQAAGSDEKKSEETYLKLREFMIKELRGKLGFEDTDDFYMEESNKLTFSVKLRL